MESTGDSSPTTRNITTNYELERVPQVICVHNTTCPHDEDTFMDKVMPYIELYMNIIVPFILSVFTLCANIINMMVLVKQGINTCVSLCLVCLSASDFLSTVAGFCSLPPRVLMFLNIRPGFDPFAFYFFMVYMSALFYDASNILTAFLSLERCLCVCLPLKFKDIFTFWRGVAVIVCIFLLCFGLLLPHFLSSGFEMRTSGNSTFLALWLSPDRAAVDVYIDTVHFCQTTVVTSTVFVCTLLMIVSLNHSSKFQGRKKNAIVNGKSAERESRGKNTESSGVTHTQQGGDDRTSGMNMETRYEDIQGETKVPEKDPQKSRQTIKVLKSITRNSDKTTKSSRNLNVIKTVIILCVICFVCNLLRIAVSTATHLEPRLRFGKKYGNVFQILLAVYYVFQLLNCSLNIFVYYRFNESFRRVVLHVLCWKPDK
ncbi:hypothetical protein RRG08_058377 [Elysia crispata]|uniref:G-protein coupled receptors family 1 profile domain-containing protein n=1 Tax=Elysia crispata TaxID=231223 RepID=A0AAE0XX33_9GAST|nr:hypothetical protein RRG08_058377 [Elysia crispata]